MNNSAATLQPDSSTHGPYVLAGPAPRPAPGTLPLRGDLAHVALAGRYFVPHYAVPQPRAVLTGGATLHDAPSESAPAIRDLAEGESFEVLDITGAWAWGCLSLDGPVGYIRLDLLEAIP
ncbi:SH3 domain-containing protein [Altericroceibacterium xinjiangense]|uniref:SH3 domain-containing protein n=1 Tax=Altericroceibacterium xinjiangense TaxID=762261 RepID=UPI001F49770D|nr:SH3 domain-containing protein [Altericroceibacterium xinjiangense]